jgi:tetratricopeptide (TPR) repeat protein
MPSTELHVPPTIAQPPASLSTTLPAEYERDPRTTLPGGSSVGLASAAAAPVTPRSPSSSRLAAFDATLESASSLRAPVSSPKNLPPIEVASIRDSFKSYDELADHATPQDGHAHAARSRWIAGVVIVGVLGLLGSTVGRRYLAQLSGAAQVKASSDERVAKFLSDGTHLIDDGDFEGAKEELDKATALAEKDPPVLIALARLETLRADVWWLKLRLIDPNSNDLVQATYRELGRRVGKARTAVDRAFAVSPEDPAVLRARVDVLRLTGDGDRAREWLAPLSANAGVPENAYVLAALDLAEPAPVWPSVIDRLRTAADAEREPGRARAALIYALASANRISEAETEFAKLDGRPKPHPLLEELRAFLQRAKSALGATTDTEPKLPSLDMTKMPKLDTSPAPEGAGDFRARLSQASSALQQGEYARAEQLYDSVLDEQPSNTEALSGLGDVAKARRDPARATQMYDRVLAQNPSYLPAILANADQKWDAGDQPGALVLYQRLLDQGGPNTEYSAHARARIAEAAVGGGPDASAVTAPSDSAAKSDDPSAAPRARDITDLPGAK